MIDDYEKVDFEGLKLKIQSVHVPEGGFLLVTLPRNVGTHAEVRALQDTLEKMEPKVPILIWRDVDMKAITKAELEDMKWRIEGLLEGR